MFLFQQRNRSKQMSQCSIVTIYASSGPSLAVRSSKQFGREGWTTSMLSCTANRASCKWRRLAGYNGWGMLCPSKKMFNSDPKFGIRCRGAQRTRWLDRVKRDLTEIGCLHGWEAAVRDRASWRIVVDQAMSHRRALSGAGQQEGERVTIYAIILSEVQLLDLKTGLNMQRRRASRIIVIS